MTGAGLTAVRKAAKAAVVATYTALANGNNPIGLNPTQRLALLDDLLSADSDAIIGYVQGSGAVVFVGGTVAPGMVAAGNPVTGTLVVTGGTIL